jgi:signal transduction histidine kinase
MPATRSSALLRSVALPLGVTTGLLFLALLLMLVSTARSLTRIQPLRDHLEVIQQVHGQVLAFQSATLNELTPNEPKMSAAIVDLRASLGQLAQHPGLLSRTARRQLAEAEALLASGGSERSRLLAGQTLLHQVLAEENRAHAALLSTIQAQATLEMRLAAAALLIIPLAALLVLYLLRRRFLTPLASLNALLVGLAGGRYATARVRDPDPILEPLIANYNRMVERLSELEAEHRERQARLEDTVREATRELLAHNRALAEAERLAAAGELAAELAHELRNPLAGIRLALENLHGDLADDDARARLRLVDEELRRVTDLMNGLLDRARVRPEIPREIRLASTCAEVLALARYQTPPGIAFTLDIGDDVVCRLPEDRLRQAMLNLLLNAAQAMGTQGSARVTAILNNGYLELAVADTGPGFPADLLAQGIRPFASGRAGGTGLGLASARRLARDLGGELRLENPQGGGAQATLRLPCREHED